MAISNEASTTGCSNTSAASSEAEAAGPSLERVPVIARSEIVLGRLIGKGGYNEVYVIKRFGRRNFSIRKSNKKTMLLLDSERDCDVNDFALKQPRTDLADEPDKRGRGMSDLMYEAKILAQINDHPNIIALRGIAAADTKCDAPAIILDRLLNTLKNQILQWRDDIAENEKKYWNQVIRNRATVKENQRFASMDLVEERLGHLCHAASAVSYLHSKRIVHRDLKPSNIGFDTSGILKVFDFGLSRQLRPGDGASLVTCIGSSRYMAPEVRAQLPYNESCDVYSFGLVIWEVLVLQFTPEDEAPTFEDKIWSSCATLRELVEETCQSKPNSRPLMHQVFKTLEKILGEARLC